MEFTIPISETEKEVMKILESRWKIGRERYQRPMDAEQFGPHIWINQAIEEACDMLQYLVGLKLRLVQDGLIEYRKTEGQE